MTNPQNSARALIDGKLQPCPPSPNCVCSEYPDTTHSIEPLAFSGDADEAWTRLISILNGQPRTTIPAQTADYIEARFRTRILRFEDVVEFRLDRAAKLIQVRSASKVGYSDFGLNRRRIETLRLLFREE